MTSARNSGVPLLRTMQSARFRLLVALLLAAFGIVLNVFLFQVLDAEGAVSLEDFEAYYEAAARIAAGEPLFSEAQLDGPIDAVCAGCYIYPPMLAQLLAPFAAVPLEVAKVGWFLLLSAAAFAAAWIGASVGGASRSWERVIWTLVATTCFFPVFHSNWLGNVGSLVALSAAFVALGGAAAGVGAAFSAVLKVSPLVYVPVALVSDARSRRTVIVALAGLLLTFILLAPQAWADTPAMIGNLLAGAGDVHWNLGPAAMAANIGWPDAAVGAIRALALVGGIGCLLLALWLARTPAGLPLAVVLASATMLLVPATLWYHYLVVLLPLAAMAWPRATSWSRWSLVAAAAVTSLAGINILPIGLSFFSAAAMFILAGWTLRPPRRVAAGSDRAPA